MALFTAYQFQHFQLDPQDVQTAPKPTVVDPKLLKTLNNRYFQSNTAAAEAVVFIAYDMYG